MAEQDSLRQTHDTAPSGILDAGVGAILSTLRHVFALLSFAIVGLIVWYFIFGGAFTVEEQEKVLVMRFGRLDPKPRDPGWNWTWPYPICEIVRIPVNRQTLVTDAFWFYTDPT
ncbi:MAG: hypothetical protein JW808_08910, partial [Victivallales bacterium]|nr:hypothetical protein [Victivallales bacterium]